MVSSQSLERNDCKICIKPLLLNPIARVYVILIQWKTKRWTQVDMRSGEKRDKRKFGKEDENEKREEEEEEEEEEKEKHKKS